MQGFVNQAKTLCLAFLQVQSSFNRTCINDYESAKFLAFENSYTSPISWPVAGSGHLARALLRWGLHVFKPRANPSTKCPHSAPHAAACEKSLGGALRFVFSPHRSSEVVGNFPCHYGCHELTGYSPGCASAHRCHAWGFRTSSCKHVLPAAILYATQAHLLPGAGRRNKPP